MNWTGSLLREKAVKFIPHTTTYRGHICVPSLNQVQDCWSPGETIASSLIHFQFGPGQLALAVMTLHKLNHPAGTEPTTSPVHGKCIFSRARSISVYVTGHRVYFY